MMIAAMVLTEVAVEIVASEIAWSELGTRLDGQYAVGMSEATPPPMSSAEQLAEWRALVDRIGLGDRSRVVAWDEVAAVGPVATYQVLVTQQVRQRLRGAPPLLVGSVAGIIAVLRVDPTEASMIFRLRRLGDAGWMDGNLWGCSRSADLLGRPSRTARGVARPDLGGMTDHSERHAQAWVAGIDRDIIGDCPSAVSGHPACWVLARRRCNLPAVCCV
jgi:hypothetical protein